MTFSTSLLILAVLLPACSDQQSGPDTPLNLRSYKLTKAWGEPGSGMNQFRQPYGSLIHDGLFYITDCLNGTVQAFTLEGVFQFGFGSFGSGNGQLSYPADIARRSDGYFFIVEEKNDRISIFDPAGNFVTKFGTTGSLPGQFNLPLGVEFNSRDELYVVDSGNHRVQKFDKNLNFLRSFGTPGSGPGQMRGPYYATVDSRDRVLVVDRGNYRVQVFDADGNCIRVIGGHGSAIGLFDYPSEITTDSEDNIYVADAYNNRVQIFNADGNVVGVLGNKLTLGIPKRVAVDDRFNVFVGDLTGTVGYVTRWEIDESATGTGLDDSEVPVGFPKNLSEYGHDLLSQSDEGRLFWYEPRWPLWTNGLKKIRKFLLPAGTRIRNDGTPWAFPEGTTFFKTFAYRSSGGLKPIETHVFQKTAATWRYAAYRWNAVGTDASLLSGRFPVAVTVTDDDGKTIQHAIPSRNQCLVCHKLNERLILGFDPLQLNHDEKDGKTLLVRLHERGLFTDGLPGSIPEIVDKPQAPSAVSGYVFGNCAHCHDGQSAFDLRPEAFPKSVIGKPASNGKTLVQAGAPESSELYQRIKGGTMPALGVQMPDQEGIDAIKTWIEGLIP